MSLLAVLMVTIIATQLVTALIASTMACLHITAMDGNCFLVHINCHRVRFHIVIFDRVCTKRFRCSNLWSWPPHLYRDWCRNIWVRYRSFSIFYGAISSFQIKFTDLSLAKKARWILAKNSFVLCLIPPPQETSQRYKVDDDVIQNIHRQCKNFI